MGVVTFTYDLQNGQLADADQVMANLNTLLGLVNGNIDAANLANGAVTAAKVTVETWHLIGDLGEPAFTNGWTNVGGGEQPARFFKDPFGIVHLEGMIKPGSFDALAWTMPVGYRSAAAAKRFIVLGSNLSSGNTPAAVDTRTNGVFIRSSTMGGASPNDWVDLSGISYRAEG